MGSYRLEEASTGRAGCQNKECKDAKTKIAKGELRFGTWVDTERIQAFMWRHWGCITPKLIGNLNEAIDEEGGDGEEKDYSVIDGYEDLSDELQEKIRGALEQGHVDDEDWKGDVEMNRPGKTGFRVRKKAGAAAKKDEGEKEPQPPKTKKRSKAQDNEEDEEPEKPAKKTRKEPARGTKKAAKEEPGSDNAEEEPKKEEEEEKPVRKTRGRAAKTASADRKKQADAIGEEDDEEMADAEKPAEKPKRGGRKKRAT
ncbi:uncharacterized protein ASPGLDRAFT_44023 [Aspergillus glaucus CBS 516.65]|uniref:PARP-type domain-containing protein n=1 Tax=Aspergillus glaucus CBS 516.65 TaxID=1160497 RepID=A0A1L9VUA1_ASPGL|nr:hypothetical protein ASPGLDRAFT_44023 [Aspergillus glaucus CBS 516.65]OJJ87470.1 hypothetical protein ASPGLDRAFT_44023 [Aspergillus glaucus CBS 516.65]